MLDPCLSSTGLAAVEDAVQVIGPILPMSSKELTAAGGCAFERIAIIEEDPLVVIRVEIWTTRDVGLSVVLAVPAYVALL